MTDTESLPSPLRDPTYRRLFSAQVVALVGTGLTTVALALLAHDIAGGDAGLVLGTALALKMVAYLGIAPVVGGFAHRLPRKPVLIGLDLGRAALVLSLPWVTEVWQLYGVIFLLNACSAGFTPLFQAAIPDILPDERRYTRALGLSRLAYDLEALLSPTLAALALLVLRFDALFLANAAGFLVSAGLVLSAAVPAAQPSERGDGVLHNLTFGVRAYLKTPRLRGLLALFLAVAAGGAMVIVNTVVYVKEVLGLGDAQVAWLMVASGAGSMLVALTLPRLLDRVTDRPVMLTGGILVAAGLALGAAMPGYAALFPLWLLLGVGTAAIQVPAARVVRRSCRAGDRAAFFSANFALTHGGWLIGYLAAGRFGAGIGLATTFLVLALLALAATLAGALLWPAGDPVALEHEHPALDHRHPHTHDEHHQHDHEGWEGPEPHVHPHHHPGGRHRHPLVIDLHHPEWPA